MTAQTRTRNLARALARVAFWLALVPFTVLAILGAWGRGPGLLIGAVVLAVYDLARHGRIPALGYMLLIVGMVGVAGLWLWAGR